MGIALHEGRITAMANGAAEGNEIERNRKPVAEARKTLSAPTVDQTTHVQKRTRSGRPRKVDPVIAPSPIRPGNRLVRERPFMPDGEQGFSLSKKRLIDDRDSDWRASGIRGGPPEHSHGAVGLPPASGIAASRPTELVVSGWVARAALASTPASPSDIANAAAATNVQARGRIQRKNVKQPTINRLSRKLSHSHRS